MYFATHSKPIAQCPSPLVRQTTVYKDVCSQPIKNSADNETFGTSPNNQHLLPHCPLEAIDPQAASLIAEGPVPRDALEIRWRDVDPRRKVLAAPRHAHDPRQTRVSFWCVVIRIHSGRLYCPSICIQQ